MRVRHGGELRAFSERFGIPEEEILDFSSNINPLGPPLSVREAYSEAVKVIAAYPDPEALWFRREVARHYPLWPENVIAGNGAMELLDLAIRFFRPKRVLLVEPGFLEYRRRLNLEGAEIRSLFLKEKEDFRFSFSEFLNSLMGVDLVILGRPNNPTGTSFSKEELQSLLIEARRRNVFVILDEAFVDWNPSLSIARQVRDDSFYFVIRSLTKFYALPGIRIGYGLGSRKLIEKLMSHQVPWSCNGVAQRLGIAALRDTEFAERSRVWLEEEKSWLGSRLGEISSLKIYASGTNFLLIRHGAAPDRKPLFDELAQRKIYIRELQEFPGLGPAYFRISVRRREENLRLLEALKVAVVEEVGRLP